MTTPVRLRIRSLEDRRKALNHEILGITLAARTATGLKPKFALPTMAVYHYRCAAKSEKSVLVPPSQ